MPFKRRQVKRVAYAHSIGQCPATGKRQYPREIEAIRDIRRLTREGANKTQGGTRLSPYLCLKCRTFHIGHARQ